MTSDSHFWEEFQPPFSGRQFKWGLNGETGEFTIWEVSGPGDLSGDGVG